MQHNNFYYENNSSNDEEEYDNSYDNSYNSDNSNINSDYINEDEYLKNNKNNIKNINNFNQQLIPTHSLIDNYNEKFYELLLQIPYIKNALEDNLKNMNQYIIKPTKIKLDDYEVSYKCFDILCYIKNKKWCTNQNFTRIILADLYFNNCFNWNSIYDNTWNQELLNFGI